MTPAPGRVLMRAGGAPPARAGLWTWVALALLLASCSTAPPPDESRLGEAPPRYSLVFIIHGDGDYSYHDALGQPHQADVEALAKARAIGEANANAEVLIFHQIARRHVLFLFPRHDGRAYYYRHGRLIMEKSYWRDQGESRFDPEVRLYEQLALQPSRPPVRMLFYFGHELPEVAAEGYDASCSSRRVAVDDLAEGVRGIAGESGKLDLVTLATCFGGTPRTIGALAPYARTIIASPDDLHLSYFDLTPLASLDVGAEEGAVAAFADQFARNAFARLTADLQTVVSVVVYDATAVGDYTASVNGAYDEALSAAAGRSPISVEHCDCADDSTYARPEMSKGLTVLYRPPRFGRMKNKQQHSGWECPRSVE